MIGFDPISTVSAAYMLVAASAACPVQGPVEVEVRLAKTDNAYIATQTSQQLTATYGKNPDTTMATDGLWMVSGVTVVGPENLQGKARAEFKTMTNYKNDTTCFSVSKVEYEIDYSPAIYIASDYKNMGCRYSATLAHEKRHVAADVKTFTDYIPVFRQQIQSFAESQPAQGPLPNAAVENAERGALQKITAAINPYFGQLAELRRKRQAEIDTIQNYERDTALCPGQVPKFDGQK